MYDDLANYGRFGGRYVAETLVDALDSLRSCWNDLRGDPSFLAEIARVNRDYTGRPTPLYHAQRLSEELDLSIYLKREDLCHTGAHKINNVIGQVALAKHLGKTRIIAETGAGQHGVATASVAARADLECVIYMGAKDAERQRFNVRRMEMLGASVIEVASGTATLKDALGDALRDWVTTHSNTHYVIGTAAGPAPFPDIVRALQSVIGKETLEQCASSGIEPDAVVACIGGGSNAIGMFAPFIDDQSHADVALYGVEAGGYGSAPGSHAASLTRGTFGVLHGAATYVLQDEHGQVLDPHSVSAGLDYPAVGPEHAFLHESGRVNYFSVSDEEAIAACHQLTRLEGILPALESSHALAGLPRIREELGGGKTVVLNLSGRGDKDLPALLD